MNNKIKEFLQRNKHSQFSCVWSPQFGWYVGMEIGSRRQSYCHVDYDEACDRLFEQVERWSAKK